MFPHRRKEIWLRSPRRTPLGIGLTSLMAIAGLVGCGATSNDGGSAGEVTASTQLAITSQLPLRW
jgi:hypothetical protein